jgi:hypothetical protein
MVKDDVKRREERGNGKGKDRDEGSLTSKEIQQIHIRIHTHIHTP